MKTEKNINYIKYPSVSQIVQTIDKDGRTALGFTVQYSEEGFYNVLRYFSKENYAQVFGVLTEEREQIINNNKSKEKKK
ncbi:hypothetical protein JEZ13_10895 [bacterium]|nr:hypothetical protein [bacterium]